MEANLFSSMPSEAISSLLSNMDVQAASRLSAISKDTNSTIVSVTEDDMYWLAKIAENLEVDVVDFKDILTASPIRSPGGFTSSSKTVYQHLLLLYSIVEYAGDDKYLAVVNLHLKYKDIDEDNLYQAQDAALENDAIEVFKLLHTACDLELDGLLPTAAERNALRIAKYLFEQGADPNEDEAFLAAVTDGSVDMTKLFLAQPSTDVSADKNEALRLCADEPVAVRLLLADPRMNLEEGGTEAILKACKCCVESLDILLEEPRILKKPSSAELLLAAIKQNKPEIVSYLLGRPDINPGPSSEDILTEAVKRTRLSILQILLADERIVVGPNVLALVEAKKKPAITELFARDK